MFKYLLVVIYCIAVIAVVTADYLYDHKQTDGQSYTRTLISHHTQHRQFTEQDKALLGQLAHILTKRSGILNTPELSTAIVAQIKARIHTEITSKISAKIFQKVKTNLVIKASVLGGKSQVSHGQIEAIQSSAVLGLQSKLTRTIEKKFNKMISDSIQPKISSLLPTNQKVLTSTQLTKVLMSAETIVRQSLRVTLPDIQKTLKLSVDTEIKAQIKDFKVDIPGVLKIDVSAKIDVVSSVKTVVSSIYKAYADVSVAVVVKSYVKGIQNALKA